jgi:sphinganine C4-monooxygenase
MHVNKFLFKHIHSVHHRLYVPYAFGSLYNHPVEGFLLDSLGAVIAETISGMTTRQAILLFSFSTLKTVDDHCGYRLPFDPLQWLSGNNADYHDIHHQVRSLMGVFFLRSVNPSFPTDSRYQIQLFATLFRALGCFIGHSSHSTGS